MSNSAEHGGYPWADEAEGGLSIAKLAVTNLTGLPESDRQRVYTITFQLPPISIHFLWALDQIDMLEKVKGLRKRSIGCARLVTKRVSS